MITILQGDAIQKLGEMSDKSIDMIFTSPPFKDEDVPGDYWNFYHSFFIEAQRVTNKVICIIHSSTKMNYIIGNYPPKRTMIWGKGISQYSYRYNPIFVYQMSDNYKVNKYIWSDAFGIESINHKWKAHSFQDPLILYVTIINMFKDCQTICDPFLGSGTTAMACKVLNRDFIGFDINSACIQSAEKMLMQESIS